MTKKNFYCVGALFVAAGLAGCATGTGSSTDPAVKPAEASFLVGDYRVTRVAKPVPVSAGECDPQGPAVCEIFVDVGDGCAKDSLLVKPDPLFAVVPKRRVGNPVPILWKIRTAEWQFQANGIRFYRPGTEIVDHGGGGVNWIHVDRATPGGGGVYGYEIKVENRRTGERCTRDPTVVNDW